MQTIETKYIGPSNVRGSRISAKASGNNAKVTISYNDALSSDDAHIEAARALCQKLNWTGSLVGGHTKSGMVFVFLGKDGLPEYGFTV